MLPRIRAAGEAAHCFPALCSFHDLSHKQIKSFHVVLINHLDVDFVSASVLTGQVLFSAEKSGEKGFKYERHRNPESVPQEQKRPLTHPHRGGT